LRGTQQGQRGHVEQGQAKQSQANRPPANTATIVKTILVFACFITAFREIMVAAFA
jgi:hypothetical protein